MPLETQYEKKKFGLVFKFLVPEVELSVICRTSCFHRVHTSLLSHFSQGAQQFPMARVSHSVPWPPCPVISASFQNHCLCHLKPGSLPHLFSTLPTVVTGHLPSISIHAGARSHLALPPIKSQSAKMWTKDLTPVLRPLSCLAIYSCSSVVLFLNQKLKNSLRS